MAWTRIDGLFLKNPKIQRAGVYGMALYLSGLIHCNNSMTDGFIDEALLPGLCGDAFQTPGKKTAQKLVEVGLWLEVDGGYMVNDFLDFNRSKDQIEIINQKRAKAGAKGGSTKAANAKQDDKQSASKVLANSKQDAKQNSTPNNLITLVPLKDTTTPPFNPPTNSDVSEKPADPRFDALFMAYQSETGKPPQFDAPEIELIAEMVDSGITPDELRVALREMAAKGFACPRISSARNWIINNREKSKRKARPPAREKPGLAGGYVPSTASEIVIEG